jgi:hypothetical protein
MTSSDEEPRDPLIESVVRELQKPVALDPELEPRIMAELRQPPLPTLGRGWIPWAALALAAGLAGMLLVSYDRHRLPKVEFVLDMPNASSVTLVGDFNNWSPEATPLSRGSQGRWATRLPLAPGRYQFTFIVDGQRWVPDPARPRAPDDFGEPTSVVTVIGPAKL